MTAVLRPHQMRTLNAIELAISMGIRRLVVQAPTGMGKTILAAHRLRKIQDTGKRGLFIVPALSLIDQTIAKLYAEGVTDVGVMQADHFMTNGARPIQVASVQTLQRRLIPEADEIIIDEVHRWFKWYPKILGAPAFENVPIIGLTATPGTKGLGKHFAKLIIGSTTEELIDTGYLSPFRAFAPASPDLSGVHTVAGDYHEGELAEVMNKVALVADVVTTWLERAKDRPTLVFAVDRAHAKHLQQKFTAAGVSAEYIDCFTDAPTRNAIAKRFHASEVKVVCNVGCLTTGIDWDVRCIVLARPTKSEMLFVQMVGRGLRTADGKADCLILDHSDNHVRLGFVTDIHWHGLDDGKEPRKAAPRGEALPKKCPHCAYLKPPKTLACPQCGFIPVPKAGAVHVSGELVELASRSQARETTQEERIEFYRQILWIQERRSYKPGWAAHQYKNRHGHFPPWAWNHLVPKEPTASTLSWVKSRQIAFAKAQRAS
jgi:DNA repair protein RadD